MNSQTSLVARNYRLQQWAVQIQDCQNRPKEMSVNDWCSQNNITKANYYYRLKCVRQACLDSMEKDSTEFVELPAPAEKNIESETLVTSAVIHTSAGLSIDIFDSASSSFIQKLLGVLNHVE